MKKTVQKCISEFPYVDEMYLSFQSTCYLKDWNTVVGWSCNTLLSTVVKVVIIIYWKD